MTDDLTLGKAAALLVFAVVFAVLINLRGGRR